MPGWSSRRALVSALAVASVALPGALTASPVAAAPECGGAPAPVSRITGTPWTQKRYPPDRLAPLATGASVTVAVVDSGVDDRHPQLKGRVLDGADYLDPGGDGSLDCVGHGTAVASIIAAVGHRDATLRGLAPGARILPVRVSEQLIIGGRESGRAVSPAQFARAVRWAVDHGAEVLNLSVVFYQDHPVVRDAIDYAVRADAVVVAAAGNLHSDGDPLPFPAAYDGVLGVGAIGSDGVRADFSQVGPYVDVVAPGERVLVALPVRGHREESGTSYATPFVSATAALVRQYRPELTARQVVERILATTDPAPDGGGGATYGSGVLNPYRAVTDTVPVTREQPAAALPADRVDPATAARQERRDLARRWAVWLAASAGAVVLLVLMLAVVLPRGRRRRWRPAG